MRIRNLCAGLIVTVAATGCAEFRSPTNWFGLKPTPTETVKNPVHRMVTVWQATDGPGLEGLPGRGFAGQILFFPQRGEVPVKIEGDVRVYVFDDQGPVEEQAKPLHQFDFPDGSLNKQLVAGSLGPTYQIFIPYTRKGPQEAKCSVRMRYTPKVGNTVYSEVIQVTLPGTQPERGDAIVALPRKSVPRVSTGDDVDTIRLDRSRRNAGKFDDIRRASHEVPDRFDDAPLETSSRSEVESAQAARIAELERRLAERLGEVVPSDRNTGRAEQESPPESFVDRSERSTPVRETAFARDQPRFQPMNFSRPATPQRDFGRDDPRFTPRGGERHPFNGHEPVAAPEGHPFAPQRPAGPSIEAAGREFDGRGTYDGRATATSGASPKQRFRLTGRPAVEESTRFGNLAAPTDVESAERSSTELDRRFSLDSEAWNGYDGSAGSREIR